jgi:hypothetical protein
MTTQQGPVAGAIQDIAADPNDANHLFVAAVNGGVWATSDATSSLAAWQPLTDGMPSLSMGAVALSALDNNTIFAGTARFSSGGGDGGPQVGVYRSTDSGNSWSIFGQTTFNTQNILRILPTSLGGSLANQVVLVGATNGVYRSTDGGQTWGSGPVFSGQVSDLRADPGNPHRFYAAIPGKGVYVSTADGQSGSWNPQNVGIRASDTSSSTSIELAAQNNAVWAAEFGPNSNGTNFADVYRSGDGGADWTYLANVGQVETINGTATFVAVGGSGFAADPNDANTVYISGGGSQPQPSDSKGNPSWPNSEGATDAVGRVFKIVYSSTGSTFAPIVCNGTADGSAPHADSRDLTFDAQGNLLNSCDGGIYRYYVHAPLAPWILTPR